MEFNVMEICVAFCKISVEVAFGMLFLSGLGPTVPLRAWTPTVAGTQARGLAAITCLLAT